MPCPPRLNASTLAHPRAQDEGCYAGAIHACAAGGRWERAVELLRLMKFDGLPRKALAYDGALAALQGAGRWEVGAVSLHRVVFPCVNSAARLRLHIRPPSSSYTPSPSPPLHLHPSFTFTHPLAARAFAGVPGHDDVDGPRAAAHRAHRHHVRHRPAGAPHPPGRHAYHTTPVRPPTPPHPTPLHYTPTHPTAPNPTLPLAFPSP